jgi:cytochrome c biogenesis protein ResB
MKEHKVITAERPDAPPRVKQKTFLRVALEWVWRELMRLRLAVWLLIVMAVTMIVGSIFPQGYEAETYISSWGETRYAVFSRLGLLNLFHTKFFKLLGIILLLNLIVCSIVRLSGRRGAGASRTAAPQNARPIAMGGDSDSAISRAVRALTERGYYVARAAGGMISARRGPWPEGVSLLYHLAMAIAIIGFLVSALHSYEGDVTLYPHEPVVVKTGSLDTGWKGFRYALASWNSFGWHPFEAALPETTEWEGQQVTLTLNKFITHWELYQDKYYPRDWMSDVSVDVKGHGPEVFWPSRLIEVNRPLRAGGLTFYQMAYEQEFDVVVWEGDTEIERVRANAYVPFTLESIEGMFFPGTLRVGTLYQKYMPTEPVVPHVPLKWQAPTPPVEETVVEAAEPVQADSAMVLTAAQAESMGMALADVDSVVAPPPPPPPERVELGDLSADVPLEVEGYTLTLQDPYEGSVLTYRHDPGVPLLYIAITAFMLGLAIRTYWPSYRVSLWIDDEDGGAVGRLLFRATGILGEPEAAEDEIVEELGGDPAAAPSTAVGAASDEAQQEPVWKPGTNPLRDALPAAPDETTPEDVAPDTGDVPPDDPQP